MEPNYDLNFLIAVLFDRDENDIPKRKPFKVPHMPAYVKENKRTINYMPARRIHIYEPPRRVPVIIEDEEI